MSSMEETYEAFSDQTLKKIILFLAAYDLSESFPDTDVRKIGGSNNRRYLSLVI